MTALPEAHCPTLESSISHFEPVLPPVIVKLAPGSDVNVGCENPDCTPVGNPVGITPDGNNESVGINEIVGNVKLVETIAVPTMGPKISSESVLSIFRYFRRV